MLTRLIQLLTLAAMVNLVYQYWPLGEEEQLIPVRNAEGKFGCIDDSGRVRIAFEWDKIYPFDEEGLAHVENDSLEGAINRRGELAVPLEYQHIFWKYAGSHGLGMTRKGDLFGFVNREGKVVVPAEWENLQPFDRWGMCKAKKAGYWGLLDNEGRVILEPKWIEVNSFGPNNVAAVSDESGWKLIDRKGSVSVDFNSAYMSIGRFGENGLAKVEYGEFDRQLELTRNEKVGWIDLAGKLVIPLEWWHGHHFDHSGMAAVRREEDGAWGWIDERGKLVLPYSWQDVIPFDENGRAWVKLDHKWGFIDTEGNLLAEPLWTDFSEFDQSGYAIVQKGQRPEPTNPFYSAKPDTEPFGQGLIDTEGKLILMFDGMSLGYFDQNGLAPLRPIETSDSVADLIDTYYPIAGWVDRMGTKVIDVPEGWQSEGIGAANVYVIERKTTQKGVRKWMGKIETWLKGEDANADKEIYQCRAYNKHGNLIWDSTWLPKTTKAWLYLAAALLLLLVSLRLGRRKKEPGGRST